MKRAYQPLLFAFAIALGLYICTMKSPKDSFLDPKLMKAEMKDPRREQKAFSTAFWFYVIIAAVIITIIGIYASLVSK